MIGAETCSARSNAVGWLWVETLEIASSDSVREKYPIAIQGQIPARFPRNVPGSMGAGTDSAKSGPCPQSRQMLVARIAPPSPRPQSVLDSDRCL